MDEMLTLGDVQSRTPDGYCWKLKIDEAFGEISLDIRLKRDVWYSTSSWSKKLPIYRNATAADFHAGVIKGAIYILNERAERMAEITTDDRKRLAKELQAELNAKT